jgi:hypothetical protein
MNTSPINTDKSTSPGELCDSIYERANSAQAVLIMASKCVELIENKTPESPSAMVIDRALRAVEVLLDDVKELSLRLSPPMKKPELDRQ